MTGKFWNWIRDEDSGERILRLCGPIDEQNFWGDSVTPQTFREELESGEGDVTVWINSPGGSVFAASEIYTMLRDYKGKITVKIDAIAASAASVVAMAGDRVYISPTGMVFLHDPMTVAMGNASDMEKAITTLNEIKESIINAYAYKTGLSRNKIAKLMSDETWMNARKAVELGFVDEILFIGSEGDLNDVKEIEDVWQPYSTKAMGKRVLDWLMPAGKKDKGAGNEAAENEKEKDLEGSCGGVSDAEIVDQIVSVANRLVKSTEQIMAVTDRFTSAVDELFSTSSENELSEGVDDTDSIQPTSTAEPTTDGAMPYNMLKEQLESLK